MAASSAVAASSAQAAPRPRVGLVLSGGGARGVAHVGVLKVLEEMRIPVDCIAGTSMGSLVGGAYATGVSISDMEQILRTADWNALFSDDPPRTEKPFRAKRDDFGNLFRFELGERNGSLLLPTGTTSGYKLEFLFRRMVAGAGNFPNQDFDQLPVPFRAVATNLESGTKTVFANGDLVKALRASMSVPGVLSPVEVGGVLHVDGGLVDNLPVDEARKTCAEVVIAVNLGSPLLKRDELNSVIGVGLQSINLLTEQNVRASLASLKPTDILVEPELGTFGAGDFENAMTTIPIGEAAARVKAAELSRLTVSPEEYAAWRTRVASRIRVAPPVKGVTVAKGTGRVNPELIELELAEQPGIDLRKRPETDFSLDNLHERLVEVYGRGDYDRMDYRIVDDGPGVRTIEVQGIEKSWGPNYVKFGLGLAGDGENTRFNVGGSYRRTWLNAMGGEWRNDLQLGYVDLFRTEFYQPLANRAGAFVAPRFEARREPIQFYIDHDPIGTYRVSYERAWLDLGLQNKFGEARAGLFGGRLKAKPQFGLVPIEIPYYNRTQVGYQAQFILDQLDSIHVPRDGYFAMLRTFGTLKSWGSDDDYNKTELLAVGAKSFGKHGVQLAGYVGQKVYGTLPPYDPFQLGGFMRGSGLLMDEITGTTVGLVRAVYTYELAHLPPQLGRGIYVGGTLEAVRGRIGRTTEDTTTPAASLFLGADTILGPAFVGVGTTLSGDRTTRVYVIINSP